MQQDKKRSLWQFFTKNHFWLHDHVLNFIKSTHSKIAFDPFAGDGELLKVANTIGIKKLKGFDIDTLLQRAYNDSLLYIPNVKNSIIITNPPYLTNYSAKRKWILDKVKKYFDNCNYNDIYKLAIEKCMENNEFWVILVPETFINSNLNKNRLVSITIIEELMFHDTETPICVICFDDKYKSYEDIKIYKNSNYIGTLWKFENMRKIPKKDINIKFNSLNGQIALRAIDSTTDKKTIEFLNPKDIEYDISTIKISSRLITLIYIDVNRSYIKDIIKVCNNILSDFRKESHDILLSPFKWNKKDWTRRRRLDYKTARAIIEEAYKLVVNTN